MPPYILLSFVIGAIYGTLFHLWRGKTLRDLLIYILSGMVGFLLGQLISEYMRIRILTIGEVHLIIATITSWLGMFFIQWFRL